MTDQTTHQQARSPQFDERAERLAFAQWDTMTTSLSQAMSAFVEGDDRNIHPNAIDRWEAWKASALRASRGNYPAAPDGWKLVPIEPTEEMREAFASMLEGACGSYFDWERGGDEAYSSMIAAAPSPGAEGVVKDSLTPGAVWDGATIQESLKVGGQR